MFRTLSFVTALLAALLGLLVGAGREERRTREAGRGPDQAGGRTERCVSCHVRSDEDPGGAHVRVALGCAACHLGNPLAFCKERAHEGMEREPGALATVASTCGREGCHPREAARLASSLMVRASGIVAVDRWTFGEIPSPDGAGTISRVLAAAHPSPAEQHLRKLCAGCHLGTRRSDRDDAIRGSGSGCSACHVASRGNHASSRPHPPVDARVPDDRCFDCHSRSGRIALSYQGLAEMDPHAPNAVEACAAPEALPDGRPVCRLAPDIHAAAGMSCTDCHLHTELMGDGTARAHEEDQVEITCETCHGPVGSDGERPWGEVDDEVTRGILRMRRIEIASGERLRIGKRGTPLWNLRRSASGEWTLGRKLDGVVLPVKQTPQDANHTRRGHERLSCSACHAAWAPLCTTCHTAFEPGSRQWDFGAGRETAGAWRERSEGFAFGPPLLAVRADGRIVPAVPGMILDIEARAVGGLSTSRRLIAALEPHTTGKRARTCESCHRSPPGPGFETGTRVGLRPLSEAERKRVATARLPLR